MALRNRNQTGEIMNEYEIGHVNKQGDWESSFGPFVDRATAEAFQAPAIEGVKWEIRPVGGAK